MTRPEHEQLPAHIRKGIDDELERISREEIIGAEALRAAGRHPSPAAGLMFGALLVLVLLTVLFVSLGLERGATYGPDTPVILVTPLTTYGAPSYVP